MNSRENALKLRVHKLEQQVAIQKMTFDRLLRDLEMTESVGCAFAWDLVVNRRIEGDTLWSVVEKWSATLQAGADFEGARVWIRDQVREKKEFRDTLKLALDNDKEMEIETPFGRYVAKELLA